MKSAIRIVDRVTRTAVGPSPPEEMEPFDYDVTLLLRLKSGRARGSKALKVTLLKPSGESAAPFESSVYFEGEEDRGVDVVMRIVLRVEMSGLYWFYVDLDGIRITQVPLRVVYMRQPITQTGGTGGG